MMDSKAKRHRKTTSHEAPEEKNQAPEPEKGPDGGTPGTPGAPDGTKIAAESEEPQEMIFIPKEEHEALKQELDQSRQKAQEYVTQLPVPVESEERQEA